MGRLNLRIPDEMDDSLEEEAGELTKSEYVRRVLRARDQLDIGDGGDLSERLDELEDTVGHHDDTLKQRLDMLDDLAKRVEDLEEQLAEERSGDPTGAVEATAGAVDGDRDELPPVDAVPEHVREAVEGLDYSGKNDEKDAYYARLWLYIKRNGPVTGEELDAVHDRAAAGGLKLKTWNDHYRGDLTELPGIQKSGRSEWEHSE